MHRDELLFQVTHQSSELWLKLAGSDAAEAARLIEKGDLYGALRLLDRASLCIRFVIQQLDMLEHMSPWEYQEIRKVLGHGSGFDSPGWNALRHVFPRLGQAFHAARRAAGLSVADVYVQGRDHEHLYRLAEALIELDEQAQHWRLRHYQVVARVIGDKVVGTQGTPVELLGRLVSKTSFPELWEVRNELTALSKSESDVTPEPRAEEVTELLQGLLRIDTVNPPGNETVAADAPPRLPRAQRDRMRAPSRASRIVRTSSRESPAATVRLSASSRTRTRSSPTPAEWDRDPWSGDLVDGEVWGRGALDMKDQVAASAVAFASLAS